MIFELQISHLRLAVESMKFRSVLEVEDLCLTVKQLMELLQSISAYMTMALLHKWPQNVSISMDYYCIIIVP